MSDKKLLALFKEKLKYWKTCLSDEKDCHSIYNQLTTLFWDNAVYTTFNEAPDDDYQVKYLRRSRQMCYDYLSGKDKDSRSRDDKLSSSLISKMEEEIAKDFAITEEVRLYVNKWVAHSATEDNRGQHVKVLDNISLHKLDK